MKKIIKKMLIGILVIIALIVGIGLIWLNTAPTFGGRLSSEEKKAYDSSGHHQNGKFENEIPTSISTDASTGSMLKTMIAFMKGDPARSPKTPPRVIDAEDKLAMSGNQPELIWFGHSAFLLQMAEKNILIDPMFGVSPAPTPLLGTKRYQENLPIQIEALPFIDFILISHDHYDHLDYESIVQLKDRVGHFYVPLGLGTHLRKWGVEEARITELNWWEEINIDELTIAATPARHFSGRRMGDRFDTFWCSWVINNKEHHIYFSGDGGYGPHFKKIGLKYGPFDFAMMECGQYNENWSEIHMTPEQTVQAAIDLGSKQFMPIHWGAFTLALHSWTDPIERSIAEAQKQNVSIIAPEVGQEIVVGEEMVLNKWWEKY